ncbi:hypothetical protein DRO33_02055 [Candidatus Bathyarchaeota archaeon]|nr:MAG: hypothetical protein DRO33_02055 [Candidatus Bathyarchaeota archaeon]
MKRFLVFLAVAALGFVLASTTYLLLKPYLPALSAFVQRLGEIVVRDWFLVGVMGAIGAVLALILWARSGSEFDYYW